MKISAFLLLAAGCIAVSVRADEAPAAPQAVQFEKAPRAIEVEARLLRIAPGDVRAFSTGLNLQAGIASTSYLDSKYEAIVAKLVEQGKAKFLSESSATASKDSPVRLAFEGPSKKRPKVTVNATPALDKADSATLMVSWYRNTVLPTNKTAPTQSASMTAAYPVSNGQTIAIKGFDNGLILSEAEAADSVVILLLTPRAVRPAQ